MQRESPEPDSCTELADGRGLTSNRRTVLRGAGAAVLGAAGLPVLGGTGAAEYGAVVNVVEDFGADPTGDEPIDPILAEAVQDDTKVIFPEGEYLLESGFHRNGAGTADSFTPEETPEEYVFDVALVGKGDVTLRPADGARTYALALWGDDVRVENFRIDQTAEGTNVGMSYLVENDLVVRDIVYDGLSDTWGTFVKIGPGIVNPGGTGLIEGLHVPDGSVQGRQTGAWVFPDHAGHLQFERCSFRGLADNAIYASGPGGAGNGSVGVENCYFENNNVSSIRLGTPGSYAKNCTVVLDGRVPGYGGDGAITARAAWLWSEFEGELKNIDVINDHPNGYGFLDYPGQNGAIALRNCRFETNADDNQVVDLTEGTGSLEARNVSIVGDARRGTAIDLANREATIRNLCLRQPGDDRDGLTFEGVSAAIHNSLIEVGGEDIFATNSDVTVRNRRENGGCPPANPRRPLE